ncbi:MAG: LrgB family protein [Lachnospiraceae bacterium]|nr:LrgB family protein [Lachnospiraceae bacterium]
MNDFFITSLFFGGASCLITYQLGIYIQKKLKSKLFSPQVFSMAVIILFLLLFDVEYETFDAGAKYVSYLLTPATVCLALPLYEQFQILKKNALAILAGILSGTLISAVTILLLSMLFGLSHQEYVTLLPKSITTAIGMGVSEELGGIVSITVASIVITGNLGNVIGPMVCKLFGIHEPIAKGIAMGTSSHVMGTSKAMEMGEAEGALGSLSIAVAGLITVIVAAVFAGLY